MMNGELKVLKGLRACLYFFVCRIVDDGPGPRAICLGLPLWSCGPHLSPHYGARCFRCISLHSHVAPTKRPLPPCPFGGAQAFPLQLGRYGYTFSPFHSIPSNGGKVCTSCTRTMPCGQKSTRGHDTTWHIDTKAIQMLNQRASHQTHQSFSSSSKITGQASEYSPCTTPSPSPSMYHRSCTIHSPRKTPAAWARIASHRSESQDKIDRWTPDRCAKTLAHAARESRTNRSRWPRALGSRATFSRRRLGSTHEHFNFVTILSHPQVASCYYYYAFDYITYPSIRPRPATIPGRACRVPSVSVFLTRR